MLGGSFFNNNNQYAIVKEIWIVKRDRTHEITLESRFPYFPWKYRV